MSAHSFIYNVASPLSSLLTKNQKRRLIFRRPTIEGELHSRCTDNLFKVQFIETIRVSELAHH